MPVSEVVSSGVVPFFILTPPKDGRFSQWGVRTFSSKKKLSVRISAILRVGEDKNGITLVSVVVFIIFIY